MMKRYEGVAPMNGHARETRTTETSIFAAFPAFNGDVARTMLWPIETWLRLQAEMLNAASPATADWVARRREGTADALNAIEKLCKCKDFQDASKVQTEWLKDESKRLEADLRALSDQTATFARAAQKAAQQGAAARP